MKVAIIPIVLGVLETVRMNLSELEIRGRIETIQTTDLLKSAGIFRSVFETREDFYHSDPGEKPQVRANVKKS